MFSASKFLVLLLTASLAYTHPLEGRAPKVAKAAKATSTSAKATGSSSAKPTSTSAGAKPSASVAVNATAATNATSGFNSMQALFDGNKKFRAGNKTAIANMTSEKPSFMFLGCSDNRLSAGAIFQAPVGSVVSQNTIANQYTSKDANSDAALTYAIETLGVQHVIVLGHYGCKGVETAINTIDQHDRFDAVQKWVKPITKMYRKSTRAEIKTLRESRKAQSQKNKNDKKDKKDDKKDKKDDKKDKKDKKDKDKKADALKADDAGFRALVEENVKSTIKHLQKESLLTKAYKKKGGKKDKKKKDLEVYVHGLVYDESSGEVKDLRVSFGPPGKTIPTVPFEALAAAKNQHQAKFLPGIPKGKKSPTSSAKPSSTSSAKPTQSKK